MNCKKHGTASPMDYCVACNAHELGRLEGYSAGKKAGIAEGRKGERAATVAWLLGSARIIHPLCEQEEGYRDGLNDAAEGIKLGDHATKERADHLRPDIKDGEAK